MLKSFEDAKSTPYETIVLLKYVYIVFTQCTVNSVQCTCIWINVQCTLCLISAGRRLIIFTATADVIPIQLTTLNTDLTNTTTWCTHTCFVHDKQHTHFSICSSIHVQCTCTHMYMYIYIHLAVTLSPRHIKHLHVHFCTSPLLPSHPSHCLFSPPLPNHCNPLFPAPTIIIHSQWTFDSFHRSVPGLLQPPGPLPAVHSEGTPSP